MALVALRVLSLCEKQLFKSMAIYTACESEIPQSKGTGTRPSVNYAKDWLDQSFLFPAGLVWSGKGFHYGCDH